VLEGRLLDGDDAPLTADESTKCDVIAMGDHSGQQRGVMFDGERFD